MIRLRWLAALLLAAGCTGTDGAVDLGQPPPVRLTTAQRSLIVRLRDDPRLVDGERQRLDREVTALATGDRSAVRAHVYAADDADGDAVRRALIGVGIDPARILTEAVPSATRLRPALVLSRSFVATTSCASAIGAAWAGNPLPSLSSVGACTQANNLAAMLADPADLRAPVALGAADGASAVSALAAWRAQRNTALPAGAASTSPTPPASDAAGAAPAATGATPAPATPPTAGNPIPAP